MEKVQKIVLI